MVMAKGKELNLISEPWILNQELNHGFLLSFTLKNTLKRISMYFHLFRVIMD